MYDPQCTHNVVFPFPLFKSETLCLHSNCNVKFLDNSKMTLTGLFGNNPDSISIVMSNSGSCFYAHFRMR